MRPGGYEHIEKVMFQWLLVKRTQIYPLMGFYCGK